MAHKKGQGSIKNGRDSKSQRRVGSSFHAGNNVGTGKDYTLFALSAGTVRFYKRGHERKTFIAIDPVAAEGADLASAAE